MITVKEIIDALHNKDNSESNFFNYIRKFLKYFYKEQRTESERLASVKEEPTPYEDIPNWQYSFIAAMVHSLCMEHDLECPIWALDKKYVLKDPYFTEEAYKDDNLRIICLLFSPFPFRMRSIFIDADTLSKHKPTAD